MKKPLFLFGILTLMAVMAVSPGAFAQQDSDFSPGNARAMRGHVGCSVYVTGDFESECILPFDKPESYINETDKALVACQWGSVTYTAHLTGGDSAIAWQWYVAGAVTQTDHGDGTITVQWGSGDTGILSVEVTNADSAVCSVEKTVLLMERPVAVVSTVPAYIVENGQNIVYVCRGESVEFIDESTLINGDLGGYWWRNNWSGATASSRNFVARDVMETQSVSHRVYNNCGCYDSVEFEIRVLYGRPLELSCYGTVCAGQTVTYTALNPACDLYAWHVEGGEIIGNGNSASVTVQWGNPPSGYGIIGLDGTLCDADACPSLMTKKIPVLIDSLSIAGQQTACVGEAVEYSVPLYGSTEYHWTVSPSPGDSMQVVQANRVVAVFPQEGTYHISVDYGCSFLGCDSLHSDTLTVTVRPRLALEGDRRICQGSQSDIHTVPAGTVANWTVRDSSGTVIFTGVGDTLPCPTDTLAVGKYLITAEDSSFCRSAEYLLTVVDVPPAPTIYKSSNPSVACKYSAIQLCGESQQPSCSLVWMPDCASATPHSVSGDSVTIRYYDTVCDVRVYNYDRILGCLSNNYYVHHVSEFQLAEMHVGTDSTVCPGTRLEWVAPLQDNVIYKWQLEENKQYCASVQGDVFSNAAILMVNELTAANAYPTTFTVMLHRNYCSSLKDTTFITLTVDTVPVTVSIDSIDPVCQGNMVALFGSCNGVSEWGIVGCDYYSFHGDSVLFDEPGVFDVLLRCNPYDVCTNQSYIQTATATVQVEPLPPFAAIAYSGGYVSTVPALSETEYTFSWVHDTTDSHTVPATPGLTYYTCVVSRRDTPNYSRTLAAYIDTACLHTEMACQGYNYCDTSATFTLPSMPSDANVTWYVSGGEYGDSHAFSTSSPQLTIPFTHLGDYLVVAHVGGDTCYYAYYVLTVDFVPGFTVKKRCNMLEMHSTSRTLTGTGTVTIACGSVQGTFPVTQRSFTLGPLPDGNYSVSLVGYNGHQLSCHLADVTIFNTANAALSVVTEYGDGVACNNTALKLTVTATPPVSTNSIWWTFSDQSAVKTSNNTLYHTFSESRTYTVTATLTDSNGCQSYGSTYITSSINTLRKASISFLPVSICPGTGMEINYRVNNSEPPSTAEYLWSGDTLWTTSPMDTVYYTCYYGVTAKDTNHCKAMVMENIMFKNSPQALIVTDGQLLCVGNTIHFYGSPDPNPENYNFVWQIRRGGALVASSIDHHTAYTPTLSGDYTVTLSITNSEGCTESTTDTFHVNPLPATPQVSFAGNRCIDTPPVNLAGSNYSGDLHWSNGHTGPTANYFVAGTATAWYYNPVTGCRSSDRSIYITPAPDFDALLTGCYNICEKDLQNFSPLQVWGLMPTLHEYYWEWWLNGGRLTSNSTQTAPLNLPLQGFGDYSLVVDYANGNCADTSLTLTLRDSCLCKDAEIDYSVKYEVNDNCRITYTIDVTVYNTGTNKICFESLRLTDGESSGVVGIDHNFNGSTIAPGEHANYVIKIEIAHLNGTSVRFVLFDACNRCYQNFTVQLPDFQTNCDYPFSSTSVQYRSDLSSDATACYSFLFGASYPVYSVLALWSEPNTVIDYNNLGSNTIGGLIIIDRQELDAIAQDSVCFYAIVCNKGNICRQHFCVPTDTLRLSALDTTGSQRSQLRFSKGPQKVRRCPTCGSTNTITQSLNQTINIVPNPSSGMTRIVGTDGNTNTITQLHNQTINIDIFDMQGRIRLQSEGTDSFDVSLLPPGQYIVRVTTASPSSDTEAVGRYAGVSPAVSSQTIHYIKFVKN